MKNEINGCKIVGRLGGKFEHTLDLTRRVYDVNAVAPTITTCGGGNTEPKIMEEKGYRFYNQAWETIKNHDCKAGDIVDAFNKRLNDSGISPTITTRPEGFKTAILLIDEPSNKQDRMEITEMKEYQLSDKMKKYINSYDDRYIVNDNALTLNKEIAPAITTREGCARADSCSYISDELPQNYNIANKDITPYQIRKLTERECGRLMGVKDDDISKIGKNLSRSAQYHTFGDSIVTACLMAIFGKMFNVDYESKIEELTKKITGEG